MLLIAALLAVAGCQRPAEKVVSPEGGRASPIEVRQAASAAGKVRKADQLARENSMTVEVPEAGLPIAFHRIVSGCNQPAIHCTLLRSDLLTGAVLSAQIRMRLSPADLPSLQQTVNALGKVVRQSSRAEDLTDAIADTEGRLRMARDYRQKLIDLQAKSGNNVEAAIKIAGELARVQQELEQLDGEHAGQRLRVETEILEVELQTHDPGNALHPIRDALKEFRANLSNGIALVITGIAYIGPWLVLLIPAFLGVRRLWRGRRAP